MSLSTSTFSVGPKPTNPFRFFLAAGLLLIVLMFLLKLAAATLIEGEQLQPLLNWLGHEDEPRVGLQMTASGSPALTAMSSPRLTPRYQWQALPMIAPSPVGNPWSHNKASLGRSLFFDTNLSLDRTLSCASCHDSEGLAGADGRATAIGVGEKVGPRNSPTVWNVAFQNWLFWDGRAASLEEQALGPLLNPIEMAMPSAESVVARVREQPGYRGLFEQAFGDSTAITVQTITSALAAYERTLITPNSPYDRYVRGDDRALSQQQLSGMSLFEELGCVNCHSGPNFSGAGVLANNSPWRIFPALDTPYEQRYQLTEDTGKAPSGSKQGVWRIPSLRNVAETAPYFHNGSVHELAEAVRIMATAQLGYALESNALEQAQQGLAQQGQVQKEDAQQGVIDKEPAFVWSSQTRTLVPLQTRVVTEDDVQAIVAFLQALSGELASEPDF